MDDRQVKLILENQEAISNQVSVVLQKLDSLRRERDDFAQRLTVAVRDIQDKLARIEKRR